MGTSWISRKEGILEKGGFDPPLPAMDPYKKVNNELFIHKQPNHQPSITKQIPAMIIKRISNISCDKECFDKGSPDYNNTLKACVC